MARSHHHRPSLFRRVVASALLGLLSLSFAAWRYERVMNYIEETPERIQRQQDGLRGTSTTVVVTATSSGRSS